MSSSELRQCQSTKVLLDQRARPATHCRCHRRRRYMCNNSNFYFLTSVQLFFFLQILTGMMVPRFFGAVPQRIRNEKKRSEETQTLRTCCSKAEPKIFCPAADPLPGARDNQNLISWRWSLPLPTDPAWWRLMHAISSYRGNTPTHPHTNTPTDRTDYNTLHRS